MTRYDREVHGRDALRPGQTARCSACGATFNGSDGWQAADWKYHEQECERR